MTNTAASYEEVNYMLRPKKQIERKILIDIFREIEDIHNYTYIGMGSVFYLDYILFHKFLHIKNMISIDNKSSIKRFNFNRPYDCIEFRSMSSSKFISNHKFKKKTIFWFDYDSKLYDDKEDKINNSILDDIATITKLSKNKTIFIITININNGLYFTTRKNILENFEQYLEDKYKNELLNRDITLRNYSKIYQNILCNIIESENAYRDVKFLKLFSFYYTDSAPMYTLGGIFESIEHFPQLKERFCNNNFVRFDENDLIDIDVPILTYKEKLQIDSKINTIKSLYHRITNKNTLLKYVEDELDFEIESLSKLENYIQFYKYYPQYYEGIL